MVKEDVDDKISTWEFQFKPGVQLYVSFIGLFLNRRNPDSQNSLASTFSLRNSFKLGTYNLYAH
jgi:hypothetical protein